LKIRTIIYTLFLGKLIVFKHRYKDILKSKFVFIFQWLLPKNEENKAYAFMGRHGITSYPSPFILDYKNRKITVFHDNILKLPFVLHNNKKLYFPASYANNTIVSNYRNLIAEQDPRSPHCYVESSEILKGRTLLDIGTAEGIFTLDAIEQISHAYLFECDENWKPALAATFEPWKEKVTVIQKYVSNKTDDICVTIDSVLKDAQINNNLFIKLDVEGVELQALDGAKNTLSTGKNIIMAICTYHKKNDAKEISEHLTTLGYKYEFTDGVIFRKQQFNKGLLRAHR
jgi:hypothetical protein